MHTALVIGVYAVVFYVGVAAGFFIKWFLIYRTAYDGAILVIKDGDKILYSIELHEDTETIEYKNELILKVKKIPSELNRK